MITREEYLDAVKKADWLEQEMSGVLKEFAEATGGDYNNYYRGFCIQSCMEHGISYSGGDGDYQFVPINFIFDRPAWEERRKKEIERKEEKRLKDLEEGELHLLKNAIKNNPEAVAEILKELGLK
jgi:hypothetical protein